MKSCFDEIHFTEKSFQWHIRKWCTWTCFNYQCSGFPKNVFICKRKNLAPKFNWVNVRSIKVLVYLTEDNKETAKDIILSVTSHDISWPNIAIQYTTYIKNGGFLEIWMKNTITLFKTRHNCFNDLYNIFYKVFFSRVKLYFLVLVHRFSIFIIWLDFLSYKLNCWELKNSWILS